MFQLRDTGKDFDKSSSNQEVTNIWWILLSLKYTMLLLLLLYTYLVDLFESETIYHFCKVLSKLTNKWGAFKFVLICLIVHKNEYIWVGNL